MKMPDKCCGTCRHFESFESPSKFGRCNHLTTIRIDVIEVLPSSVIVSDMHCDEGDNCPCHEPKEK